MHLMLEVASLYGNDDSDVDFRAQFNLINREYIDQNTKILVRHIHMPSCTSKDARKLTMTSVTHVAPFYRRGLQRFEPEKLGREE